MKKLIAVTIVAIMMFALGASAFALVTEAAASSANPPVWISGMTVSDAWMSGLTMQNWNGSLTQQAYAEGNYIWFIARISVSAPGDTEAEHLWTGSHEDNATLTIQGKDNCLNLSSANMATLAKISGMSVTARQINNNAEYVTVTANKASFTFRSEEATGVSNNVLQFNDNRMATLGLDGIYGKDTYALDGVRPTSVSPEYRVARHAATLQKDYFLHFMAIANASTEGVCIGTLKVNGADEFKRQGANIGQQPLATETEYSFGAPYSTPGQIGRESDYLGYGSWYNWNPDGLWNDSTFNSAQISATEIKPGDRSIPVILYNTYNKISYAIAEINGAATPWSVAQGWRGGYSNGGSIYVLMSKDCQDFKVAFHVDGTFRGLLAWSDDYRDGAKTYKELSELSLPGGASWPYSFDDNGDGVLDWAEETLQLPARTGKAGDFDFFKNRRTWDAAYYMPLTSNDTSSSGINLVASYHGGGMPTSELEAIFNFFGFAYTNPRAPTDADFLLGSALTSTAEARYNVANAVITTPDATVVIPTTGDAATSTGLILVASAILAAAAVGFVLSKRVRE